MRKTKKSISKPILITPGAGIGLVTSNDKITSFMERFGKVLIPSITKKKSIEDFKI